MMQWCRCFYVLSEEKEQSNTALKQSFIPVPIQVNGCQNQCNCIKSICIFFNYSSLISNWCVSLWKYTFHFSFYIVIVFHLSIFWHFRPLALLKKKLDTCWKIKSKCFIYNVVFSLIIIIQFYQNGDRPITIWIHYILLTN